jgi:hypothetical protein
MKRFAHYCFAVAFIVTVLSRVSPAQTFEVISLDGSAKVQRVQKKDMEKLAIGSQLHDNDIVESYFQTKCVLRFGKGNVVIVGSNSKLLVNIREKETAPGSAISDVNLTLFSGACFVKAISQAHIGVYTSNAVGETDNGSFSTVVESKTGETGFQLLGGSAKTRNIAQKEGINLASGQTTMILPGKEPTAPLFITYKHVSVLKHFFGDDYIVSELEAAGIKPTEDRSTRSSLLSEDQLFASGGQDLSTYKSPFSLNRIFGAILADREKEKRLYSPISMPAFATSNKLLLEERTGFAVTGVGSFPSIQIIPSYSLGALNVGLRLSLSSNYTGSIGMYAFSSGAGVLDVIDHVIWGSINDPLYIAAGPLRDFTMGNGLVVDNFSNADPYRVSQPLGLAINYSLGEIIAQAFIADLSQFSIGGIELQYGPSRYHVGAGFFFDGDQYQKTPALAENRFVVLPQVNSSTIQIDSVLSVNIYELRSSVDAVLTDELKISLGVDFAQKFQSGHTDGFTIEFPAVSCDVSGMRWKGGLIGEWGRLIAGEFNYYYMSNRCRIDSSFIGDTLITANAMLSPKRMCEGVSALFGIDPYRGTSLEVGLRLNFAEKNTFNPAYVQDTSKLSPGMDLSFSFRTNDSLIKAIKYGEIYLRHDHTGLYPPRSGLFSSWGFSTGLRAVSNPIAFGISLDGEVSFSFLDLNSNNRIDPGDMLLNFSIGIMRGFL